MTIARTRDDAVPLPFTGYTAATFRWFPGLGRGQLPGVLPADPGNLRRGRARVLEALLGSLVRSFPGQVRMFPQNRDVRLSPV
jgi:hypothetical protein